MHLINTAVLGGTGHFGLASSSNCSYDISQWTLATRTLRRLVDLIAFAAPLQIVCPSVSVAKKIHPTCLHPKHHTQHKSLSMPLLRRQFVSHHLPAQAFLLRPLAPFVFAPVVPAPPASVLAFSASNTSYAFVFALMILSGSCSVPFPRPISSTTLFGSANPTIGTSDASHCWKGLAIK
jgi:hypothetical protein